MKVKLSVAVNQETIERINDLMRSTYRGKGDLVDWVVAEAWEREVGNEKSVSCSQSSTEEGKTGIFPKNNPPAPQKPVPTTIQA